VMWTGLVWLRIGTGGEFLWIRLWGVRACRIVYSRPHVACSFCPDISPRWGGLRSVARWLERCLVGRSRSCYRWRLRCSRSWVRRRDLTVDDDSFETVAEWCVDYLVGYSVEYTLHTVHTVFWSCYRRYLYLGQHTDTLCWLAVVFAALIGRYIRASDWWAAGPSCGAEKGRCGLLWP
jgi:hypothetical protein